MQSERELASGELSDTMTVLQQKLWATASPGLQRTLRETLGRLDTYEKTGEDPVVKKEYDAAQKQLEEGYAGAKFATREMSGYRAKVGGYPYRTEEIEDQISRGTKMLSDRENQAQRMLAFQRAQANMGSFNNLMGILGQTSQTALGLGAGSVQNQMAAIAGLSGTSPFAGTVGGAAQGASIGGTFGGGWGAAAGAVVGGVAGYMGTR